MTSAVMATLAGMLCIGGLIAVMVGLQRSPDTGGQGRSLADRWGSITRRPSGPDRRRRDLVLVASVMVGVIVAAVSGWVVAVVITPALVLGLPALLATPRRRDLELLEALDRWVRSLSATLPTGKSITDAIRLSRRTAPALLQDHLSVMVARLNSRWDTRDALMRFADELDSPDADGVVAALILAAQRGSNGAASTLNALADSLQVQLRGRRLIETERAKPYIVVRQVTVITLGTLVLAMIIGRDFFSPYRTPVGQLILTVLIMAYAASLVIMRRRARPRQRQRILVGVHR
ncbi:type II secretion system F family protein [Microlunatus panaciterrae]|uniref:Flp pilus assembly protein TadB n=1 Tax=Microlunatus panaciterrae TaxID=400768 RepID=A0ABS2RJI0_9ACTN|nr:type II secretion system F family protein [Microlunatus panaciterrae]MBM7798878.1 Flp pilus assembly protein TadB [Microlunatus panaciterrae]